MTYDINSIDDLVSSLGGDSSVGEMLGISQAAVGNWKLRRHIANGWHLRLLAELRGRGKSVNPIVFGMSEAEVGMLCRPEPRAA